MALKKVLKKVAKKTVAKSYSGDEVKRYLGSLSEDFQHKVGAIGEQFSSIHADTKETRALVGSQEKVLNFHTVLLSTQAETLKAHTEMISRLMEDMNIVKSDVQEIKTDMKQKVDLQQFARLEKRVIAIESREYLGKSRR